MLKNKFAAWLGIACLVGAGIFGFGKSAKADTQWCFCHDNVERITAENFQTEAPNVVASNCYAITAGSCTDDPQAKKAGGAAYDTCDTSYVVEQMCNEARQKWQLNKTARGQSSAQTAQSVAPAAGTIIPKCLLQDNFSPECRDISIFIEIFINGGRWAFTIVGSIALLYFVYGGFVLILSQGNPEKIKQGTDTMLTALIGMIIMFAGYMLVRFLAQTLNVLPQFRLR